MAALLGRIPHRPPSDDVMLKVGVKCQLGQVLVPGAQIQILSALRIMMQYFPAHSAAARRDSQGGNSWQHAVHGKTHLCFAWG